MSDLVQRLRGIYGHGHRAEPTLIDLEAANRIEALERIHALWADQEAKQHQAKDARITDQQQCIEALEAALRVGVTMRAQQVLYFKNKCREQLIASKAAEKAFDEAARRALSETFVEEMQVEGKS